MIRATIGDFCVDGVVPSTTIFEAVKVFQSNDVTDTNLEGHLSKPYSLLSTQFRYLYSLINTIKAQKPGYWMFFYHTEYKYYT
jgi:hypothetical protein